MNATQRIRLLVVANVNFLGSRLDRNQFYRYEALGRRPGVILFGPGIEGYRPGMVVSEAICVACGGQCPDFILHGVDLKESGVPLLGQLSHAPCPTIIELMDSWARPDRQAAFIREQRFCIGLLVVWHHRHFYQQQCPETEFLWTPNAVNTQLFKDYSEPKRYDVLLYGMIEMHTYPLRTRLASLLHKAGDLRFRHIAHPGYYPSPAEADSVIAGASLSREINRAWIAIATSSIYGCMMTKYFEIAASRALIAGDMPDEGRDIFGDDFLELFPDDTDDQLMAKIRDCLVRRELVIAKTERAHQRVIRDHSADAFADRLLQMLAQYKALTCLRPSTFSYARDAEGPKGSLQTDGGQQRDAGAYVEPVVNPFAPPGGSANRRPYRATSP